MNKMKFRAIISSLLLVVFIVVVFTGFGLVIAHNVGDLKNWKFVGLLSKKQLLTMHVRFGFAMVFLIIIHLSLNWKLFIMEIKSLFFGNKK